jgi:proline iminopeptidase
MKFIFFGLLIALLPAAGFCQAEGFADNGDVKIFYRTFGHGTPLLIINGGPGMNSDGFVTLAKKLSGANMAILYDQRGTGRSFLKKIDNKSISMALMVADMEALRKKLNIEHWIILGHSFGGMLASYYTALYPGRVDKLVLSSSGGTDLGLLDYVGKNVNAKLTDAEKKSLAYWTQQIRAGDTSYHARLERGKALAPAYVYNREFVPVIAERLTQGNAILNEAMWADMQRIGFDCNEKLRSFDKPVLIIQGLQDIIEQKTALKAKEIFKHSTLVFMDKCVHYGWLDRPDIYFPAVASFLK